ncbi:CoA-transferase [Xanthobacter sp. KR7-65]|uniref:acyl CoA:acetate/3-ketoacid CoA transferase n=1 Tax=Xanthobacter sp. KR7-65 TaxID=3156612 RepID=UPI0032B52E81
MNAPMPHPRNKVVSAEVAAGLIRDGDAVACVGVIGWITPDHMLKAVGERFARTGTPRGLTFYFPVGTGDAVDIPGMDHVAREGLMKRIVSGSYINPLNPRTGQRPALMGLIRENKVEAYSWPIGATMHWLREVARRSPGYLTKIGLGTYADPRHGGGKFTTRCQDDLIEVMDFRGEEHLFYPTWPLNVGIIRAASADEFGNLSWEDEPLLSSNLQIALAVKASGGKVIAQVRRIVPRHSRPVSSVRVPGVLVDAVVVDPEMVMSTDVAYDPGYLGMANHPLQLGPLPISPDKVIARRAAREVRPGEVSIFGFGASSDAPQVMAEDGLLSGDRLYDYDFTTEHGPFGGFVMSGWQFSANWNPDALLDGASQFDFIDGGLCPFAALAFAQFDDAGCVNVSKFGVANPGAGGFIDIAANAKRLVFTGTFTTAGLDCSFADGRLSIVREGKVRKFVTTADSITYRVRDGVGRGQEAMIITERAVFRVEADGLVLAEVADGIDVKTDILDLMEFKPVRIADPLPRMDPALFK